MKQLLLIPFFFLFINFANGQQFKASIIGGVNFAELDSDELDGRIGWNVGTGVSTQFAKKWKASLELLYSQNGFYLKPSQVPVVPLEELSLHFIEVPLELSYLFRFRKPSNDKVYQHQLNMGVSYARLFKHKAIDYEEMDISDQLQFDNLNAILFNFGVTAFWNESIALNGKGTLSTFGEWTIAIRMMYFI